ncbi:DUF397 domain-containing protein [Nocardia nepalensis]|uniref:DUF397 domain-containing protein n=1 Tax=Nocardia nepalensis TaxID=3375448 RepID=UPI003B67489F
MISQDRLTWRTSSYSGTNGGQCVEVAFDAESDTLLIRDSKYRRNPANDPANQPMIAIRTEDWAPFLAAAAGENRDTEYRIPTIERQPSGEVVVRATDGTALTFTQGEWTAFTAGVQDGEFAAA